MLKMFFKLNVMKLNILIPLILGTSQLFAGQSVSSQATSAEDFHYDHYYTIHEDFPNQTPDELSKNRETIKLYQFDQKNETLPYPTDKYSRAKHFGAWIKPDSSTCLNTRGLVLKRESSIETQNGGACTIRTGQWHDPYTDQDFQSASDIQIDHLVPLKNAYMTGAFEWDSKKRCLYANFLGNRFHLVPVSGVQNEEKGDRSPAEYMPPNTNYQCEYLRNWLEIKLIWSLRLTPFEVDGLKKEIAQNNCSTQDLSVSVADVQNQRKFIEEHADLCK